MPDISSYDIAIVGGGLVGSALALALRHSDYRIALIDTQAPTPNTSPSKNNVDAFEPRVSALTQASIALLDDLEIWNTDLASTAQAYQHMQVWDELGTAEISFNAAELYCSELGYIIENQHLLAAMHQTLAKQANLSCYWQQGVAGFSHAQGQQLITLDNTSINASLLVGADGANSRVRQLSNLATREWDYEHTAIVCTVETELPHQKRALQRFSEFGPLAFLPLKDEASTDKFSSIVWSISSQQARTLMALSDDEFKQKLAIAIESKQGKITAVSKRFCFPLRQRHAKDYVQEGLALIGDAAHTIHPLAGQGVNLGFKDVAVLSRLLSKANEQDLPLNTSLLKRYQRERQGDNLLMMTAMEGFKQLFGNPSPLVRWARNTGLDLVNKQSFIKNQLAKHAMGL